VDSGAGDTVDFSQAVLEVSFAFVGCGPEYRIGGEQPAELNPFTESPRRTPSWFALILHMFVDPDVVQSRLHAQLWEDLKNP
jgi:hypothetical protein